MLYLLSLPYTILDYRKKRNLPSAFRLYGQLKARKLIPDIIVFIELLNMLSHDDPRVAMLFEDMRVYGIPPSVNAHNVIMSSEGRAGNIEAVRTRLAMMHAQQLHPNTVSFTALIQAHKVHRDAVGAKAVLNEMRREGLPPDT
jgi:pentatricopeptide repeat protein